MEKYKVGVVGCTGMVGQRFVTLLENHPWFQLTAVAASGRSAGKTYAQAVEGRWKMAGEIPAEARDLMVLDIEKDLDAFVEQIDFTFCAVNMPKAEVKAIKAQLKGNA